MPQRDRFSWSPFDWLAWMGDRAVRLMTYEQRGRYIDFLAMTNQTDEPGVHTEAEVMAMLGYRQEDWAPVREVYARAFKILDAADGSLWIQQRTVDEAMKAQAKRTVRVAASQVANRVRWHRPNRIRFGSQADPKRIRDGVTVDSRQETLEATPKPLSRSDEAAEFFQTDFWPTYPRKTGTSKANALKALQKIAQADKGDLDDLATAIMTGLKRHIGLWAGKDEQFIPHAATWLNQRRWEDA